MTTPVPPGDGKSRARVISRRRIVVSALALACMVAALLVARDWVSTRSAAAESAARLDATRASLHRTDEDLDATRDRIAAGEAELRDKQTLLAVRKAERMAAQGNAEATLAWLTTLQDQLNAATAELDASSGRLEALQTCMGGVARALNQVSAHDSGGVARTMRDIEDSCATAGVAR
jgi:hypothetical protein